MRSHLPGKATLTTQERGHQNVLSLTNRLRTFYAQRVEIKITRADMLLEEKTCSISPAYSFVYRYTYPYNYGSSKPYF
jgi:hypothetical protein